VHGLDDAADAFADSAGGEHLKVLIVDGVTRSPSRPAPDQARPMES
jgi:hypothetical protein